jgi:hypothetical protein
MAARCWGSSRVRSFPIFSEVAVAARNTAPKTLPHPGSAGAWLTSHTDCRNDALRRLVCFIDPPVFCAEQHNGIACVKRCRRPLLERKLDLTFKQNEVIDRIGRMQLDNRARRKVQQDESRLAGRRREAGV